MTRLFRRRTRRKRNNLVVAASLIMLALAAWYSAEELLTPNVVVRVLFSETANCTQHERLWVAGVMKNRIGNPAFGNSATLKAVVRQAGAFSCIGDSDNANWQKTRQPAFPRAGRVDAKQLPAAFLMRQDM